jgi:hypothetical protein
MCEKLLKLSTILINMSYYNLWNTCNYQLNNITDDCQHKAQCLSHCLSTVICITSNHPYTHCIMESVIYTQVRPKNMSQICLICCALDEFSFPPSPKVKMSVDWDDVETWNIGGATGLTKCWGNVDLTSLDDDAVSEIGLETSRCVCDVISGAE